MWHFKITTMPVLVEALGMTKKGPYKVINKVSPSPSQNKMQRITL